MAKSANAGQLRTPIAIQAYAEHTNANGFTEKGWSEILTAKCLWAGAWGSEFYEAARSNMKEPATITMRYSPLVKIGQRVIHGNEDPYEILGVNNIDGTNMWLELKVARVVAV